MSGPRCAAAAAALLVAALPASAGGGKHPDLQPWSIAVEARWGDGSGPDAIRADVERAVAESLGGGCVAGVDAGREAVRDGRSDLVLVVTLDRFAEEVRFDDPLATAVTPGEPTRELRRVAIVEVDNELALSTREGERAVASKSFHAEIQHRPVFVGEEPQAAARTLLLERIVDETRKLLCKSGGKLATRVRQELEPR
jgi:hypothetical protein